MNQSDRDAAVRAWLTSRAYPEPVSAAPSNPSPPRFIRVIRREPSEELWTDLDADAPT